MPCKQPGCCFRSLQDSGANSEGLANQIGASLESVDKLIANLQMQSAYTSSGLYDEEGVESAEAVIKAKSLSAAASLQPVGSSIWCERMQSLVNLMGEIAVPQQQLHQAKEAFHQAKQKTLACDEKNFTDLKAHTHEVLRLLSIYTNSSGTAQQSMQSACANTRQLETQHAVHQRVCAIVQANYRHKSV